MAEHKRPALQNYGNSFEPIPDEVVGESATQIVERWFEQYFPSHAVSLDIILAVEELKKRLSRVT